MQRLFLNKLGTVQLPEPLPAGSMIAVSTASFWVGWYNIWNTARFIIVKDQGLTDDNPTYIDLIPGLYTLKMLQDAINTRSKKSAYLDILPNGDVKLQVAKGYMLTFTDPFKHLLGIPIPENHKHLKAGDYFGTPEICNFKSLRLYCDEISDKNNLLQGVESKILQHFQLRECEHKFGDPISYDFKNPFFIPLAHSTNSLNFRLTEEFHQKNIEIRGVRIELIIKDGYV